MGAADPDPFGGLFLCDGARPSPAHPLVTLYILIGDIFVTLAQYRKTEKKHKYWGCSESNERKKIPLITS